jgi:site-specific DNA recombinase
MAKTAYPTTTGALTTALLYTRVSTDEQARNGLSLDAQLAEIRRYAARHEWIIGSEYQDVLKGTRDDRPGYQALLADVQSRRRAGKLVVVVVAALDRFGRDLAERVRVRNALQALGVATHSAREGGEVSDLVANILATVAQEEVRRLGERVAAVRSHTVAQGWAFPGQVPWGYQWRKATEAERRAGAPNSVLEVEGDSAPLVQEAFARVAGGESVRAVSYWLASLPNSVRQDRAASPRGTRQMLGSKTYLGQLPDGRPGRWEALITPELFERVQARIANHRRVPRQASGRYLLTGLLRCPRCASRMAGKQTSGSKPARYHCLSFNLGARAPVPGCSFSAACFRVDGPVLETVGVLLDDLGTVLRADLHRAWRSLEQPQLDAGNLARVHEQAAEKARERLKRLALLYADGELDRQGYDLGRLQAQADLDLSTAALEGLEGPRAPRPTLPDLDTALRQAGSWRSVLASGSVPAQRDVLAVLLDEVVPERVGFARFEPRLTWTPLGEALRQASCVAGAGTEA